MKKKISIIIAVIVVIALIAAAVIFHYLSNRTHFNEGYVNGNTAGNLYNGGLFCEYDGTVYFSNPSDGGKLYSMSPDGSNLAKLCDDTVSYIISTMCATIREQRAPLSPFSLSTPTVSAALTGKAAMTPF